MGESPIWGHEAHAAQCAVCRSNEVQIEHMTKKLERKERRSSDQKISPSPKFLNGFAYVVMVAALIGAVGFIGVIVVIILKLTSSIS